MTDKHPNVKPAKCRWCGTIPKVEKDDYDKPIIWWVICRVDRSNRNIDDHNVNACSTSKEKAIALWNKGMEDEKPERMK